MVGVGFVNIPSSYSPIPRVCAFDLDGTLIETTDGFADIAADVIHKNHGLTFEQGRRLHLETSGVPFFQRDGRTPRRNPIAVDFERVMQLDSLIERPPQTLDDLWEKLAKVDQILDLFKRALRVFSSA